MYPLELHRITHFESVKCLKLDLQSCLIIQICQRLQFINLLACADFFFLSLLCISCQPFLYHFFPYLLSSMYWEKTSLGFSMKYTLKVCSVTAFWTIGNINQLLLYVKMDLPLPSLPLELIHILYFIYCFSIISDHWKRFTSQVSIHPFTHSPTVGWGYHARQRLPNHSHALTHREQFGIQYLT